MAGLVENGLLLGIFLAAQFSGNLEIGLLKGSTKTDGIFLGIGTEANLTRRVLHMAQAIFCVFGPSKDGSHPWKG